MWNKCHRSVLSQLHAKLAQKNAQNATSVARGWATHSPRQRIALVVVEKLREYGWEVLPHPPYSPDMSPPDFDLFPKLKEPMRGRRYSSLEELSTTVTPAIRQMNKNGALDGIIKLPRRWDSVIQKQGDYTG